MLRHLSLRLQRLVFLGLLAITNPAAAIHFFGSSSDANRDSGPTALIDSQSQPRTSQTSFHIFELVAPSPIRVPLRWPASETSVSPTAFGISNRMPQSELTFYPDATAGHQIGRPTNSREWEVDITQIPGRYITYGPYTQLLPAGPSTAKFTLMIDNNSADNYPILTLDVFDSAHQKILAQQTVRRNDFKSPMTAQDFELSFTNPPGAVLEMRVFWNGNSYVRHLKTTLSNQAPADYNTDPMGALWQGRAQFRFQRSINWPVSEGAGWTVVKDGAWYVFNRDVNFSPQVTQTCGTLDVARTVVRVSYDKGATWSEKVVAAEPIAGNSNMNCAILDGSTFFDEAAGTWHLLTQCMGTSAKWKLCHFTRQDPSPLGPFVPDSQNPVVEVGQLWSQICGGALKSCPPSTIDEGTPDILYKKDGYFYVTFHGFDPGSKAGYRGVSRTPDFKNWQSVGADLPGDAIFNFTDCQLWNPGCIGGGEATTIRSGGYHYMLIEAPDKSLTCEDGQFWVFGLMRSKTLASAGHWESFSGNPLMQPSRRQKCGLQYARFLVDGGQIYMLYEDFEKGRRLFKLEPGAGQPLVQ